MLRKYWSYALCALKVYGTCAGWHASGGIWPSLTHDLELKRALLSAHFLTTLNLKSSSFSFGNDSKLSFSSLTRDLELKLELVLIRK